MIPSGRADNPGSNPGGRTKTLDVLSFRTGGSEACFASISLGNVVKLIDFYYVVYITHILVVTLIWVEIRTVTDRS